ncbi:MAG TPA: GNAT family N-acetyltransferase [Candidatus Limnocylindrales bacterium]|nr:GNAT family N-acetyltransferase [Candidatus Limnocylindrales bacterium]
MSVSPVTIREARPEEFDAVADLTVAAYYGVPDDQTHGYVSELRDVAGRAAACLVLVAVDTSDRVLGAVTYVDGPGNAWAELEREDEAGFRMLAVAPDAQRRGIGRLLAEAVIARARAAGRGGIAIHTRPSMVAAHRLYESLGFVRDPQRDWEFAPGEWLWAMALRL